MRGLVAIPVLMMAALAAGPSAAASPSVPELTRDIVVDARMLAPCPSVLGCRTTIRLTWPYGTTDATVPLDGANGDDPARTHFAVHPGPVHLDLVTAMITGARIDFNGSETTTEVLAACSLDLVVPDSAGPVPVTDTIRFDWPALSPGTMVSSLTPDWSCEVAQATTDREGTGSAESPAVVSIQAPVCGGVTKPAESCHAAIAAAGRLRVALAQAPLAIAVPACPDTASCAFPTYAVSFSSREGDTWPWSDTLLVSLDPAGAVVVPWPDGPPPPPWLRELQENLPGTGDRLGAAIDIPTSPPIADGAEAVCLTATTAGALTRHPSLGVVLANEEGFTRVTWPSGWSAREAPEGFVVVDAGGETVARERQIIRLGGGETAPGEWLTCGDVSVPFLI